MLFLLSESMAEISLCTERKVFVDVRASVVHAASKAYPRDHNRQGWELVRILHCGAVQHSWISSPNHVGVVGVGALIRSGEREVEQCFETIGQIECCMMR